MSFDIDNSKEDLFIVQFWENNDDETAKPKFPRDEEMRPCGHRFLGEHTNGNKPLVTTDEFEEIGTSPMTEYTLTDGMQSQDAVTENGNGFMTLKCERAQKPGVCITMQEHQAL